MKKKNRLHVKGKDRPPAKLTEFEQELVDDFFYLPEWQFDTLFIDKCILIYQSEMGYKITKKGEKERIVVKLYGLKNPDTNEEYIATFFIRYGDLVYQCEYFVFVVQTIEALTKGFIRDQYEEKIHEQKRLAKAAA